MQPRRQFVFQENLSTGANLSLGNFKINLQADELIDARERWEEAVPLMGYERIKFLRAPIPGTDQ